MPTPGSKNSENPRKVALANAYCDWSDLDKVVAIYRVCAVLNELDLGETFVVDHVIPLTSPLVCGLHTHTNLAIVTQRENRLKGNLYWPGMGALTWETFRFMRDRGELD